MPSLRRRRKEAFSEKCPAAIECLDWKGDALGVLRNCLGRVRFQWKTYPQDSGEGRYEDGWRERRTTRKPRDYARAVALFVASRSSYGVPARVSRPIHSHQSYIHAVEFSLISSRLKNEPQQGKQRTGRWFHTNEVPERDVERQTQVQRRRESSWQRRLTWLMGQEFRFFVQARCSVRKFWPREQLREHKIGHDGSEAAN